MPTKSLEIPVHLPTTFSIGETVTIERRIERANSWSEGWTSAMDGYIGQTGQIIDAGPQVGYLVLTSDGESFFYPSCALTAGKLVNDLSAFKKGDRVGVIRKTKKVEGWNAVWVAEMDALIGNEGTVLGPGTGGGFRVDFGEPNTIFSFPSCALRLTGGNNVTTQMTPVPQTKKTRRARVGAGPWDSAPCTHLRWQLMGFFREKLALVKTKVTVKDSAGKDMAVEFSQIEVACTKCNTKMTLKAK